MSKSALIKSSLAKKYWMSATGLFFAPFFDWPLGWESSIIITPDEALVVFNEYARL